MKKNKKTVLPWMRSLNFMHVSLFFSALFAFRVFIAEGDGTGPPLVIERLAVPAIIAIIALALEANRHLHKKNPLVRLLSSNKPWLAALLVCIALPACYLDVRAGLLPLPALAALLLLGLAYWNQPKFHVFAAAVISGGVAAILRLDGGAVAADAFAADTAVLVTLSLLLTALAAELIRRNVLPSEERMESLEEENRELWNLSYRDTLTGLYNRRYMQQTAEHLFNRAVRYRELLWVLMIDIDHFKKVNDKLGHAVGDEVLKKTAQTIQTFVRSTDTVARYGGEEFIVFIVQSSAEMTQYVANRIRDGVANMHMEEVPWPITISIGVAGRLEGDTLESQIARSDQFLYMAKKGGRNRVSGL